MDLRDYLLLLARHWILLAVAAVVGVAAAGVVALVTTPQYAARADVVFTAHNVDSGQDQAYAGTYVQSRVQTYRDLATSDAVLAPVIEQLELDESAADLADRTEIEVSQVDTVVGVIVEDPSAKQAAKLADAVATSLVSAVGGIERGADDPEDAPVVVGQLVGPADAPADPAVPNVPLHLLAGLLVGLLLGFGVVGVRHVLRAEDDR
jgi:capsular polysaccharide biosynthesis protein